MGDKTDRKADQGSKPNPEKAGKRGLRLVSILSVFRKKGLAQKTSLFPECHLKMKPYLHRQVPNSLPSFFSFLP